MRKSRVQSPIRSIIERSFKKSRYRYISSQRGGQSNTPTPFNASEMYVRDDILYTQSIYKSFFYMSSILDINGFETKDDNFVKANTLTKKNKYLKAAFGNKETDVLSFWYLPDKESIELVRSMTNSVKEVELKLMLVGENGKDANGIYQLCSECRLRVYNGQSSCLDCFIDEKCEENFEMFMTPKDNNLDDNNLSAEVQALTIYFLSIVIFNCCNYHIGVEY